MLAVNRDGAAQLVGEATDLRQAQAGSVPDGFGGEERVEYARQKIFWYADAGIRHRYGNKIAFEFLAGRTFLKLQVLGEHRQGSAVRHGIAGVDSQVARSAVSGTDRRPSSSVNNREKC